MSEMVKERPPNPIEFLASYLLQHDPQRITDTTTNNNNSSMASAAAMAGGNNPVVPSSSLPLTGSSR
jgi:hypothetical protein